MVLPQKAFIVLEIAKNFVQEFSEETFFLFLAESLASRDFRIGDLLANS